MRINLIQIKLEKLRNAKETGLLIEPFLLNLFC